MMPTSPAPQAATGPLADGKRQLYSGTQVMPTLPRTQSVIPSVLADWYQSCLSRYAALWGRLTERPTGVLRILGM